MTVDAARFTTNLDHRTRNLDLDGVGGANDSVRVRSRQTVGLTRSESDPESLDGTVELESETTANVDSPRNPAAASAQRQAAFAEQDRRAMHFLQQAGYKPGDDIKWERSGGTLRAEVRADLDDDGVVDDAARYESTLRTTRGGQRRAYSLRESGSARYGDVARSSSPAPSRLEAPSLGQGDGLSSEQVRAYREDGRYTAVGADAPLEPGVRSDRLPAVREQAIANLEAVGVNRDTATTFGGPQDDLFGPKTNDLLSVERQVRALHDAGVTFDADGLNGALAADEFALDGFDISSHVSDWGENEPNYAIALDDGTTITVPDSARSTAASDAVGAALDRFDELATNGVVTREQLASVDGGEAIAERLDSLIFANPGDRGAASWSGLSRGDLETIKSRLESGETLAAIADDAMANSFVGRELAGSNGRSFSREAFSAAVDQHRNRASVGAAIEGFDELSSGGFVSREALERTPGGAALAERFDALIFGSIESGDAAWRGLSREDLVGLKTRLDRGESLDDISNELMNKSFVGRRLVTGGNVDYATFARAVARERAARS